jgi:hypothetical protein
MVAPIREYARRYAALNYPHNPQLMRKVYFTDVSTSTLVWKEGEYLVEYYLMHPLIEVVPHAHPFESITIHIGGKMLGRREGVIGEWLTDKHAGHIGGILPAGAWHAFSTGDTGAIVYVVSRWDDPAEMDSATIKYLGAPLGPMHEQSLAKLNHNKSLAA